MMLEELADFSFVFSMIFNTSSKLLNISESITSANWCEARLMAASVSWSWTIFVRTRLVQRWNVLSSVGMLESILAAS